MFVKRCEDACILRTSNSGIDLNALGAVKCVHCWLYPKLFLKQVFRRPVQSADNIIRK